MRIIEDLRWIFWGFFSSNVTKWFSRLELKCSKKIKSKMTLFWCIIIYCNSTWCYLSISVCKFLIQISIFQNAAQHNLSTFKVSYPSAILNVAENGWKSSKESQRIPKNPQKSSLNSLYRLEMTENLLKSLKISLKISKESKRILKNHQKSL